VKLPVRPNVTDFIQIQVGDYQFVFVFTAFGQDAPVRIAEIRRAEEFADIPRRFGPDAIDRADEISVGHGVRALFQLPKIIGMPFGRRRRNENYLGAVQTQGPRAFGEMPVVADVDADARVLRLKSRETKVARREIELLPEAGQAMWDVSLAVLAQALAVGVNHRRRVVVDACHLLFVDRRDDRHPVLFGDLAHQSRRRPIRDALDQTVPVRILFGGKIRAVEKLLQADDLNALFGGVGDHRDVLLDHRRFDLLDGTFNRFRIRGLDQTASDNSWHYNILQKISPQSHTKNHKGLI